MQAKLQQINKIIKSNGIIDFRIESYDGENLLIIGSLDLCYYHQIEIRFQEVSYLCCPTNFIHPLFSMANTQEIELINKVVQIEPGDNFYCIEAETSSSLEKIPFYLVARKISFVRETVFYYTKNSLKPGERLAPWL